MLSLRSSADMARALDGPLDPQLKDLLRLRRNQLKDGQAMDLSELAHFIILGGADKLSIVETELALQLAGDEFLLLSGLNVIQAAGSRPRSLRTMTASRS